MVKWIYIAGMLLYLIAVVIGTTLGIGLGVAAAVVSTLVMLFVKAFEDWSIDSALTIFDYGSDSESDAGTFIDTFESRKENAKSKLDDIIALQETKDGEIEFVLDNSGMTNSDRKAMLYVFSVWFAFDENARSTPVLSKHEIRQETDLTGMAVGVFLDKMGPFIQRHYPEDPQDRIETDGNGNRSRMNESDMMFEINQDELEEIVDYILGERYAPN